MKMDENVFKLWSLASGVIVVLILSVTTYSLVAHSNRLKAISNSATPVAVACALESNSTQASPTCLIALSKGAM